MPDETAMPEDQTAQGHGGDEKETALLPASLFGSDCKVGDTYRVKVVGKYDSELEVEHAPDKKEGSSEEGTMQNASEKLDKMGEPDQAY